MKKFMLLLCVMFAVNLSAQQITMEKGKFYQNGKQISTYETKTLIASNYEASVLFKKAKSKEGLGGFLLGFGIGLTVGDVVVGLVSDSEYPSAMTYIGAASIVTSIPVLSGRTKKLKKAIEVYNNGLQPKVGYQNTNNFNMNIIANANGYGLRITF